MKSDFAVELYAYISNWCVRFKFSQIWL